MTTENNKALVKQPHVIKPNLDDIITGEEQLKDKVSKELGKRLQDNLDKLIYDLLVS